MGIRKTGHRASQCTTRPAGKCYGSAFVAIGALLGIKPVGSNAEHVIALDADAVNDRTNDGAGPDGLVQATRRGSGGFLRAVLNGHGRIVARRGLPAITAGRHPRNAREASLKNEGSGEWVKREQGIE